ncbi:hypothetical protein ACE193_25505 (plasmid) [Bernardetia sp. OM2101]|uniref:hypothetical protein n=1 Tax=Bernardetia sp. OM2101 TaxID=3344876 RepID=UPI0035D0CBB3
MENDIEDLLEIVDPFHFDIKVEALLSALLAEHSQFTNRLLISNKGQFARTYRREILGYEVVDFKSDNLPYLLLNIAKDSIYDALPEGVFHYPKSDKVGKEVTEMTKDYRRQKKEEANARKFFMPFENEFWINAINRDVVENELLHSLSRVKPFDFFYEFWKLDKDIPTIFVAKLIKLLPYVYQIVGNLELTAQCLSYILEENVEYEEVGYKELSESEQNSLLGETNLGLNMILGSSYMDYSLYVEFKIGAIKNGNSKSYFYDGEIRKFIDLFYEYFLPIEVEAKTIITLLKEEEEFFISHPNMMLGITTRI